MGFQLAPALGTALLNRNCTVGIFTASTDSTVDACAVEVSHNSTHTVSTAKQFNTFPVEGWRHLHVTYSNNSGVDHTIGIDSAYWK
jgi:hypothetical protein